jgi:D-alanyl-D-alanine carboxypeptidase
MRMTSTSGRAGCITDIGPRFRSVAGALLATGIMFMPARPALPANADAAVPASKEVRRQLQAALDGATAAGSNVVGALASVSAPRLSLEWNGASGQRNPPAPQTISPGQPFRIASITKVFTAATVLRLMEEHRLGLFDPIASHLSAATLATLRAGGYEPGRITAQQLLAHTSGLYDYASDPAFVAAVFASPRKHWTRAEEIEFAMTHGKPAGRPGERYAYSDTGYLVLGEAIENITQQPLPRAVREQLDLKGLGLASTYFETLETPPPGSLPLAHQFLETTDTSGFDPSFDLYGGGGLVSTTQDLDRFFRALLQGRVFKQSATLAAALMTVDTKHGADEHPHANLLTTWRFGRRMCWGHLGFWGSEALYCPDADIAVSFTLNQATPHDPEALSALAAALASVIEALERDRTAP